MCDQHGAVLIFDEVMTGFRVALGGAQALYGITPDLTTLGKIIGGGMPVGAFGGRRDIMEQHRAARARCIRPARCPAIRWRWRRACATLAGDQRAGLPRPSLADDDRPPDGRPASSCRAPPACRFATNHVCGMFGLFFSDRAGPIRSRTSWRATSSASRRFFHAMLDEGVYLAPSAFEAGFVSAAHTAADIDATIAAARRAFAAL